jgi:hypothetical protein
LKIFVPQPQPSVVPISSAIDTKEMSSPMPLPTQISSSSNSDDKSEWRTYEPPADSLLQPKRDEEENKHQNKDDETSPTQESQQTDSNNYGISVANDFDTPLDL